MSTADLARQALVAAGRVRLAARRDTLSSLCIYDLVLDHFGDAIELRFQALPSLEGMYSRSDDDASVIIVSSLRSSGRQRFSCAHELGHHVFGHGTHVDELVGEERARFSPDEFIADSFAGFLLMPKLALLRAFTIRQINVAKASPIEMYRVACAFGVSYGALIRHLQLTLGLVGEAHAKDLLKTSPKQIRLQILGRDPGSELHLVDEHWGSGRAVDVSQGDLAVLPKGTRVEGERLRLLDKRPDGDLYEALGPGIGRLECSPSAWSAYVRIERHEYAGRGMFRHEEECDE